MIRGGKEPLSVDDMVSEAGDPWPRLKTNIAYTLSGGGIIEERSAQQKRSYNAISQMVRKMPAGFAGAFDRYMNNIVSVGPATALSRVIVEFTHARRRRLVDTLPMRFLSKDSEFQAVAAVLADEYGIQPLVPGLLNMHAQAATQLLPQGVIDLPAVAERLLDDPRKEAEYQDNVTRLLFIVEARLSLADFAEELKASASSPFEQAGAILKFRNNILSWLWWCARIVDEYEIDWSAHPMPWQLP